ncbi:hypothetical protein [Bdellovibrio bacteriovorus]|uniref:hypothetical protein n=1 Tax=Bdellovibrio bacteriovorus TaxID=959 RepID=UPI0035A91008
MRYFFTAILPLIFLFSAEAKVNLTDAQITTLLIEQSQQNYSGSCPCPYNVTRNGRSCGKRSAYSRPGGAQPLCYSTDVTKEMIQTYRDNHR